MLLIGFFFSSTLSVSAQVADVYIQVGASYTAFLRKSNIKIDNGLLSPQVGAGLSFYLNNERLWKIKAELKSSGRYYDTSYPESEFHFRTFGLEINSLAEYTFSEKIGFEAGLGVYFYQIFLIENSSYISLGNQDRSLDVNLIVGGSYQLYKPLSVGFRTSFGLIPMVKTQSVGKYGDMDGEKNLLNALTPELFIRSKLYRRNKE